MRRLWIWYEKLSDLWRLLFVLAFVGIGIGAISLGFATEKHNPFLVFGGFLFILLLFLSRIRFLNQKEASRGFHIRRRP